MSQIVFLFYYKVKYLMPVTQAYVPMVAHGLCRPFCTLVST